MADSRVWHHMQKSHDGGRTFRICSVSNGLGRFEVKESCTKGLIEHLKVCCDTCFVFFSIASIRPTELMGQPRPVPLQWMRLSSGKNWIHPVNVLRLGPSWLVESLRRPLLGAQMGCRINPCQCLFLQCLQCRVSMHTDKPATLELSNGENISRAGSGSEVNGFIAAFWQMCQVKLHVNDLFRPKHVYTPRPGILCPK